MNSHLPLDVLICGAGAAGLTLAIDLARRGLSFRVIEKMDVPFPGSRGKGIQPRTQEIFEDLGLLDRLVAVGGLYPPPRAYRADGSWDESPVMDHSQPPTAAEPHRLPLLVPQFLTERLMRDRLAELGHRVAFGRELLDLTQDAEGVTVRMGTPSGGRETVRAHFLVGADGGRSTVRKLLDIGFPGKTLGVRAVAADVSLRGLERDAWHRFNDTRMEAHVSLCPLAGTPLFQLQAPVPLEGEVDLSAEGLTAMVAQRTGRDDIRIDAVSWASAFHMNARLADRYRVGRVLLAGDAAHVHPPTGGQGLNTSIQDAYNLGWKLERVVCGAPDALLDTYEEERRPVAARVLGLASALLEAAGRGDMRRGREVQQLDIGYPGSSIALELPERTHGLLAGARAPDAPLRGAAGQSTRLFELFKGPHWTLLGHEVPSESIAPRPGVRIHHIGALGELRDDGGHFQAVYEVPPGHWVLVRPDGHIGAMVSDTHRAELEAHLESLGLAGMDKVCAA